MIKAILLIILALFAMFFMDLLLRNIIPYIVGVEYFYPSVSMMVILMFVPLIYFNKVWFKKELLIKKDEPKIEFVYVSITCVFGSYLYVLGEGFRQGTQFCIICYLFTGLAILFLAIARQIWGDLNVK